MGPTLTQIRRLSQCSNYMARRKVVVAQRLCKRRRAMWGVADGDEKKNFFLFFTNDKKKRGSESRWWTWVKMCKFLIRRSSFAPHSKQRVQSTKKKVSQSQTRSMTLRAVSLHGRKRIDEELLYFLFRIVTRRARPWQFKSKWGKRFFLSSDMRVCMHVRSIGVYRHFLEWVIAEKASVLMGHASFTFFVLFPSHACDFFLSPRIARSVREYVHLRAARSHEG